MGRPVPVGGTNQNQRGALVPVGAINRNQRASLVPVDATNWYQRSLFPALWDAEKDLWYRLVAPTGTDATLWYRLVAQTGANDLGIYTPALEPSFPSRHSAQDDAADDTYAVRLPDFVAAPHQA